jgi:hypothetical protein
MDRLGLIGPAHPSLVQLIRECLHNNPDQRPSADMLLTTLQAMRVEIEGEYGVCAIKLDMVRVNQAKKLKMKDRRIEELTRQQVTPTMIVLSVLQMVCDNSLGTVSNNNSRDGTGDGCEY